MRPVWLVALMLPWG